MSYTRPHEHNVMVMRCNNILGLEFRHLLTPRDFLDFNDTLLTMQKQYGALHNINRDLFSEGKRYNRTNENKYKVKNNSD